LRLEDPSILATSASDKPCTSRWYYPKLAVLREALDVGIAELDAGQGVETSPEKLMDEVFAEVGLEP